MNAALVLGMLSGCTGEAPSPDANPRSTATTSTTAAHGVGPLSVSDDELGGMGMQAGLDGRLGLSEDCLFVRSRRGGPIVPVWPGRSVAWLAESSSVQVGEETFAVGDRVRVTGGEVDRAVLEPGQLNPACRGRFGRKVFIVNDL